MKNFTFIPLSDQLTVWSGEDANEIRSDDIEGWLSAAAVSPVNSLKKLGLGYTLREGRHARSWMEAFLRTESNYLLNEWSKLDHKHEIKVKLDRDNGIVEAGFYLSGSGLSGHTRYGIFAKRVEFDVYLCFE